MQMTISSGPGWDLVKLDGELTSEKTSELEELLQRFLTVGHYNVILDLSGLRYIGSAGLSLLIRYSNACRRWERGDLHLAAVPPVILNLFQVAGLVTEEQSTFSIYSTLDAAQEAAQKRVSR